LPVGEKFSPLILPLVIPPPVLLEVLSFNGMSKGNTNRFDWISFNEGKSLTRDKEKALYT
jgi:hypothetical protein